MAPIAATLALFAAYSLLRGCCWGAPHRASRRRGGAGRRPWRRRRWPVPPALLAASSGASNAVIARYCLVEGAPDVSWGASCSSLGEPCARARNERHAGSGRRLVIRRRCQGHATLTTRSRWPSPAACVRRLRVQTRLSRLLYREACFSLEPISAEQARAEAYRRRLANTRELSRGCHPIGVVQQA